MTRTVLLVPHRPDGGARDELERWTRDRWEEEHPAIAYLSAPGPEAGPFNRSAAINEAAALDESWDLALIADSDSFVEGQQIPAALGLAAETGQLVVAHDHWRRLTEPGSRRILDGFRGSWEPFVEFDLHLTVSSMIAIPRQLWEEARGFDPGFEGWGMEDVAFHAACDRLAGGAGRIPGPVWHLWHPKNSAPTRQANIDRMHRYTGCESRAEMLELIAELRA